MIRSKHSSKAATILELVIVLVLASVIVAAVIGYFALARTSAQVSQVISQLGTLETQLVATSNGGRRILNLMSGTSNPTGAAAITNLGANFDTGLFSLTGGGVQPNLKVGGAATTLATMVMPAQASMDGSQINVATGNLELIYGGTDAEVCNRAGRALGNTLNPVAVMGGTALSAFGLPGTTSPMQPAAGQQFYSGANASGISVLCGGESGTVPMVIILHSVGATGNDTQVLPGTPSAT